MNKKNILLLCAMAVFILTVSSCKDDSNEPNPSDPIRKLAGTKWQLTAFVDVENDTRRPPDYENSMFKDSSFSLSFDNDSLISGYSARNWLEGKYSVDYNASILLIKSMITTQVGDSNSDGHLYEDIMTGIDQSFPFKLYSQELHLFYNDGKECLEFKKIGEIYEKEKE